MVWLLLVVLTVVGGVSAVGIAVSDRKKLLRGGKSDPKALPAGSDKLERTVRDLRVDDVLTMDSKDFLCEGLINYDEDGHRWSAGRIVDGKDVQWLVIGLDRMGAIAPGKSQPNGALRLEREMPIPDSENEQREALSIAATQARPAVAAFRKGQTDLVLGGTFDDLPAARIAGIAKTALRFDPVSGLFGLRPTRQDGPLKDANVRALLSRAIDRQAIIAALAVPGLVPRATVLEAGLDGLPAPVQPDWLTAPIDQRRVALRAEVDRLFGNNDRPVLRLSLTDGPGANILFDHLAADWAALGIRLERAGNARDSDLVLIDEVAPSTSPAWFVRHFRCVAAAVCDSEVDTLLDGARRSAVSDQRWALLADAAKRIDAAQLFIPIAAPVRWSLVSPRITGFAGNRFGLHTLTGLREHLANERSQ